MKKHQRCRRVRFYPIMDAADGARPELGHLMGRLFRIVDDLVQKLFPLIEDSFYERIYARRESRAKAKRMRNFGEKI